MEQVEPLHELRPRMRRALAPFGVTVGPESLDRLDS